MNRPAANQSNPAIAFTMPPDEELALLRADPLLWEQELDVRPDVAESIERAVGKRAGRVYWRSSHGHLYALELADLGRGRPSMAMVLGFWDHYEPRPPEHEIDLDLLAFCGWIADQCESLDSRDVFRVAQYAGIKPAWDKVLRTPEDRFAKLPGFAYEPRYIEIEGLRMAYVEHGAGDPILMLHGEPTWGYLYRHMIPPMSAAGRVIVPDLIGFGRSDKPASPNAYSYKAAVRWMRRFITALDLERITLICQDWGGLVGLRVLADMPDRFSRLVATNTGIPTGRGSAAFDAWRRHTQRSTSIDLAWLMRRSLKKRSLSADEEAAYCAPFPSPEYQVAALTFPRLVPTRADHPGAYENRLAIERLRTLDLPVLLPWGGDDPVTAPGAAHLRSIFRNVTPPAEIEGAGHFIQEDAGVELARLILTWIG